MKKNLLFVAAAAVMLASCQKSLNETDSIRREIRLGLSTIEYETKAFVESTNSTLQSNGFKAAGVIDADNSTMFNKAVVYSNGAYIVSGEHYYFPNEGTVSFYGIYPADEVITIASDGKASVVYAHNSDDDLIGAKKKAVARQSDAVALDFEHLLSQVSINTKSDDANVVCKLYSLTVNDANGGTYSFEDGNWTLNETKVNYTFFSNTGGQVVTTTASAVGSAMSLMPGEVTLNVKWKCYDKNGDRLLSNNDVTIPVTLTKGKRTAITLLLPAKASEIKVSSSVDAWNDESQNLTAELPYEAPELVSGVFTVNNSGKKVKFAKGNLYWNGREFRCEDTQYTYLTVWDTSHVGHFFWSQDVRVACAAKEPSTVEYTAAKNKYGITYSVNDKFFAADGGVFEGFTVLSGEEWEYLISHVLAKNSSSEYDIVIEGKVCAVLKPDGFSGTVKDTYSAAEWATAESTYGLVALPNAGYITGDGFNSAGYFGFYWSSSLATTSQYGRAYSVKFDGDKSFTEPHDRYIGNSIRLVQVQ